MHRRAIQGAQDDRCVGAEVRERFLLITGHQREHRPCGDRTELLAELGADLGRGLVGVVEHEQRRRVRLARMSDGLEQRARRLGRGGG